jgi:tetratricopeptide (TPR) repeat protein
MSKSVVKSHTFLPLMASCVALLYCAPSAAIPIVQQEGAGSFEDKLREIQMALPKEGKFVPITRALQAGNLDKARSLLDPILASTPDNAAVLELDGTIRFKAGDLSGAAESFRRALSISPDLLSSTISLGLVEIARGNLGEARELLQKATKNQAYNAVAHKYLARIAVRSKDLAQAEKHYLAAIQASSHDAELYNELGVLYLGAQRYLDAQKLLEPAAQKTATSDPGIPLLLAQAYLKQGKIEAARQQLDAARKNKAGNTQISIVEASADRADGKLDTAADKLRLALKDDPDNVQAHYLLGLTLAQAGQREQALEELEIAAQGLHEYSQIRVDIARLRLAGGETDKAIALLEPMMDKDSTPSPVALQLLSEAYARTGRAEAALGAADTLTRRFPEFTPGFLAKAIILHQLGRQEEARATALLATQRFPGVPATWLRYADLEIKAQHPETAQKVLENGLDRHPDNDTLRFQLAVVYQNLNKRSKAEALYRRVLETSPGDVGTLNNLAMVLAEDKAKRQEALQLARKAQQLAPGSPAVEDTLGWILYLSGDYDEAGRWLSSANSKLPEDPNILCRLGVVFNAQGDSAKARTAFDQCLPRVTEPWLRELAAAALSATR